MARQNGTEGSNAAFGDRKIPTADTLRDEIEALHALDLYELRARWQVAYKKPSPRFFRRDLLIRAIAYHMQAEVYGGLSPKTHRLLLQIAKAAEAGKGFTTADMPRRLSPGTRLIRAYNGVTHSVDVAPDGSFSWNERRWRSLSAIAKEITGTNWSGYAFFGLKLRKGDKTSADA